MGQRADGYESLVSVVGQFIRSFGNLRICACPGVGVSLVVSRAKRVCETTLVLYKKRK